MLDAKLQDRTVFISEEAVQSESPKFDMSLEAASQLSECHLNLQDAITKYESIVEHLERLWEDKVQLF